MNPPFSRTICACPQCVACCQKPAHLIPGDMERISARLVEQGVIKKHQEALNFFKPGKGATVMNSTTGVLSKIPTIVPKTKEDGWCVFNQPETHLCSIHDVSPHGCSAFDIHQDAAVGHERSLWGLRLISSSPAYGLLVGLLKRLQGGT